MISHVDPFLGVDNPGFCLCGPYLPHSIVRLGPDTLPPHYPNGYSSDRPIIRFSHNHVSGTGGGGRYGNVGVTPFLGTPHILPHQYERKDELAQCGYYAVTLTPSNIRAELTLTPRVGVHRYTFPSDADANLLFDAGSVIQVAGEKPGEHTGLCIGGFVEFVSDTELIGRGDFRGGWGHQFPYSVYFCARFDKPATQRLVANLGGVISNAIAADGPQCKAVASFGKTSQINLQVAISYVSIAKARASLARESAGRSFDQIRQSAAHVWTKSLSRIHVEGGTPDQLTLFYSLFSRLICMPTDLGVDDENPLWHSGVRQFTDFYCLWDSVRNANSLITLFDPDLEVAMLNSLLDIADHTGWIPDAWVAGHSAHIQGGSSADVLLCEAHLKGLQGIDYEKALRQMRKNNEVESPDPWMYGRYLKHYRDLGYVSTDAQNCVSRHIEYAYQDWCIATLASRLGHCDIATRYYQSSTKLWNLWRDDLKSFSPRQPNGQWINPFDPTKPTRWDFWLDPYFYEGSPWQWSFSTHHDFAGLIQHWGGPEAFIAHLDHFFDDRLYLWKENMLHVPWLYHYSGRPDKTADRVRSLMAHHYHLGRNGISDNEDMGCQSTFYMCSAMGLYPIMGQDLYLLSSPIFPHTDITLGNTSKHLIIETPGATSEKCYIQSATLNGQPLNRPYLRHSEIANGATLHLTLSPTPTKWGTTDLPHQP